MATPNSKQPVAKSDTTQTMRAIKIGSTAKIMTQLAALAYGLPVNTPQKEIAPIVLLEAQTAHLRNEVFESPNRLNESVTRINGYLRQLGETKSTIPLQQTYYQQFVPLKADAEARHQQREQLENQIRHFLADKRANIDEIIHLMQQGNLSKAQLSSRLEPIKKQLQDLSSQANTLKRNEDFLQRNLDRMAKETAAIIPNAGQINVIQPSEPRNQ